MSSIRFINLICRHWLWILSAMILLLPDMAPGDKIIMKNGKVIKGRILTDEEGVITLLTPTTSIDISKNSIERIERDPSLAQEEILGDIAYEDQRYAEALDYYEKALKTGKNRESLDQKVQNILKIQEREIQRRFGQTLQKVDRHIEQKQYCQAEMTLKGILSDLPSESLAQPVRDKLARVYYFQALEYLNTVNDLKAEECLKKAIDTWDKAYYAHLLNAELLARNPRTHDEAIKNYLRGLETGGRHLPPEQKAYYHRQTALLLEEKGEFEDAIKHHEQILDLAPINYPDTKERIVEGYLNLARKTPLSNFEQKKAYLEAAIETDSYSANALFELVTLYYENEMVDEALRECSRLLQINSRMPDVHYYQAMCYLKKRNYEKHMEALERELALNPNNYDALCAMGDYLLNGGQYENAITYYEKARDLRKEKYRAYIGLARAYRKIEKPKEARKNLDEIFLTNPDHIEATILSGSIYKDDKEYKKARKLFDDVVNRLKEKEDITKPEQKRLLVEALNQRGELNLLLDSPRISLADFSESLNYESDYAETYYHIAQTNIKLGKYKDAESNYFKAQSLDPENPKYYLGLAIMYHNNLKKTEKAIANYTKYIELGGEDFEKVNEWIKECGGETVQPKID